MASASLQVDQPHQIEHLALTTQELHGHQAPTAVETDPLHVAPPRNPAPVEIWPPGPLAKKSAPGALLSAHRAAAAQSGVRDNSREALLAAIEMDVDYVEFDVHRTGDGFFVLLHDSHVTIPATSGRRSARKVSVSDLRLAEIEEALGHQVVSYLDALATLTAAGKRLHIDLKFTTPLHSYSPLDPVITYEEQAAGIALSMLQRAGGTGADMILTTMEDRSVRVLSLWAATRSPQTLVGLSLGRDIFHLNPITALRVRLSEIFPARRLRRCGATLLVCNYRLADLRLLRWAARQRQWRMSRTERGPLRVLVWTVDSMGPLNRYLNDPRVWMVTTNHPNRALGRD